MNSLVKVLPSLEKYNDYIFNLKKGVSPIMLSGLTDVAKVHMAYSTKFYTEKPICIVTYNELQAKKIINDLAYFEEEVKLFPKRDLISFDYIVESKDTLYSRIEVLNDIYKGNNPIIVTTIEAMLQKMIKKDSLYKNVLSIKVGDTIDLEKLKEKLILLGYERYDLIEGKGQFSIRGGIVDVATSKTEGVRIELWGDEVDSIRNFNISTQRTTEMIGEFDIYPSFEFLLEDSLDNIAKKIDEKNYPQSVRVKVDEDIEAIKEGDYLNKIDKYFNEFYPETDTLLDYLSDNYIVFIDEIEKLKSRAISIEKDNESLVKDLISRNKLVPGIFISDNNYEKFITELEDTKQTIYLERQDVGFIDKQSMHAKRNGYSFSYREVNFFRSSMDLLFKELQEATKRGKGTIVLGGNAENSKRLSNILLEHDIQTQYMEKLEDDLALGVVIVTPGAFSAGFEFYDANILLVSIGEMFEPKPVRKKKMGKTFKESEKIVFADLKEGDYIVHRYHGIGQYIGVNTIRADGVTKDYVKIKYLNGDLLYVPTDSLDNIRKYIGDEKNGPRLNKLGSKDWEKTKAKVKSNLREVAEELIELYAKRQKMKGYAFSKDTAWQNEFENSFNYVETDDQLRCIEEIKKDMEADKPMDRLLCGDVGYGKTEVAMRAAFKAVMDGKQVAYLAPTTVLSNQQLDSFKERMKDYPVRIDILNRFKTKKEQKNTLNKLENGNLDILIGTHRILSNDVKFKNLGLLIVDEEHRFGVKAKEKIKEYKNNVDVLTMTATPIPRTLHMSIVGMRDLSVIYEPPQNRKPVQTYVFEYDEEVIKEAITKEIEREGQVFYLYNNVEGIEKKVVEISQLVPEAKVVYAHGKMTGNEIENIMEDFVEGKTNVLVCTTILESGIDIPNANTIIVENADRLGLAQLYQIRGRVGRSDRQAYAYITYKRDKMLSEVADSRLKAIKEFTEFGSGYKIAMRDLEIRGAGSLMGEIQHGHMEQVGYDMYCRLLDEVVKELRGEKVEEEKDIQIDINLSSYIPEEYISSNSQKIEVYQNIALCKTEEDILNVTDEIIDRYGPIPKEIENLLDIVRIKTLAGKKNILKIIQRNQNVLFYFDPEEFDFNIVNNLIKLYKNKIKFSPSQEPYITLNINEYSDLVKAIMKFLNCI
ncbi:MAG: transcription-repair coupling factor [Clostridia bacterium]|nr:transcription-repair coupling factor [Clostridia bacterium]